MVDETHSDEVKTQLYNQPFGTFKRLKHSSKQELKLSSLRFMLPNATNIEVPANSTILLGRQEANENKIDVDLSAFGASSGVSRNHAAITVTSTKVCVRDLGSRNGVFINGEELFAMRDYELQDGDELKLGNLKLRVIFVA